jgi:hypothetical protein
MSICRIVGDLEATQWSEPSGEGDGGSQWREEQ